MKRTVAGYTILPAINQGADRSHEPYIVCEVVSETELRIIEIIESQPTYGQAYQATQWLTEHERKCGRNTIYEFFHAPLK